MGKPRKSAVMILLEEVHGEIQVIFEVRSYNLRHQPGDICLPGGKLEENEEPKVAALRETVEELKVKREDIEYIGAMDYLVTPYGFVIYPFVSKIKPQNIEPNKQEVDHIFRVPLDFFINNLPEHYEMNIGPRNIEDFPFHLINRGKDYKFSSGILDQYFYKYENYLIWGFTARIIKEFIDIIKEQPIGKTLSLK